MFFSDDISMHYSRICPKGHLPLTVTCVMCPLCFCTSAAHYLLKQSVLNGHLSDTATNFGSLGDKLACIYIYPCVIRHKACLPKLATVLSSVM
jgi:hypothetical protein